MAASKKQDGLVIAHVEPQSLAQKYGIHKGDRLVRINGHRIRDPIDYRFYESDPFLNVEIEHEGVSRVCTMTKEVDEDLGLELKEPHYKTCRNHCIFCFVHQMPRGLRSSLYFKDDDYRLSFLHGNYITLTNLDESDYERILQQKLSPLYISVHATDDRLRQQILGNRAAPPLLPAMKRLIENGIQLHAQIVLCPGINDGSVLKQSIQDLMELWPGIASLAVVPVGFTCHRKGLEPLRGVDEKDARSVLDLIHVMQEESRSRFEEPWVFPSDEFYLKASRPFPTLSLYGDLSQLENGVGMIPLLEDEFERGLDSLCPMESHQSILIGTSVLAFPIIRDLLQRAAIRTGCKFNLVPIPNQFFGDCVTVSGLITGSDLIRTFAALPHPGPIILPSNMLRSGKAIFLDGLTSRSVEKKLGRRLYFVESNAQGLLSVFQSGKHIDFS